jgi:hypothetical protein
LPDDVQRYTLLVKHPQHFPFIRLGDRIAELVEVPS